MKKSILSLVVLGMLFTGCSKKFYDINDNPNLPTDASVTADLVLPFALHETGRIQAVSYGALAQWMGWWARGGDFGPNVETETYNITTNFGAGTWASWYNNLNDYQVIVKKTAGTDQNLYHAIARIMKTVGFMHLVDTYNNVPYTEAFNLSGFITPKYDKGAAIYSDLLKELDASLVLLNAVIPGADPKIATADIMFKGNVTKWKKFVNTQRLRLVVRLSQTTLINHSTELTKVTSDGYLMQGETAGVNPAYAQVQGQQNPYWDAYRLDAVGTQTDKFNRANNYTLNALRSVNDIRYQYYYETAVTPLSGNLYYGYNFGENLGPSNQFFSNNSSAVGGPGLAKSPGQSQWIITSVESMFLQAEAKQRGYIAGSAQAAFEDAIRESYSYLGVTNAMAEANAYIASANQYVNWAGAANKIQLIVTQKYFSTVGLTPFQAWADFRRTGFPNNIPPTLAANAGPNIPVRWQYPQAEYNVNPANVAAEGTINVFTGTVFWDL